MRSPKVEQESTSRHSAVRILAIIVPAIFVMELCIHLFVRSALDGLPDIVGSLVDSALLTLVLYPLLLLLVYRPLVAEIAERKRVQQEREELLARLREAMENAERNRAQLEAVFQALSDGVVISDLAGNFILINEASARTSGFESTEDMKRNMAFYGEILEVSYPNGPPVPFDEWPISKALRGESFANWELRTRRKDTGQEWFFSFSGGPVRDEQGQQILAVVVTRDITERKRAEQEREQLLEQSRELNQRLVLTSIEAKEAAEVAERRTAELDAFIHTISHDLRNPLTIILGQAQMVQRMAEKPDVVHSSGQAISTSAKRMNAMIQDLVDSARSEAGGLKLNKQPVDLTSFVSEMLDRAKDILPAQRIETEIRSDLPPVEADPDRLERILMNLLTNALKYSSPETMVQVKAKKTDSEVIVSIVDHGVGIDPTDLGHIFERFYRAKGAEKVEGLGLGLYITKMLVEAHGGRTWAESEQGKGSTFYFSLPVG